MNTAPTRIRVRIQVRYTMLKWGGVIEIFVCRILPAAFSSPIFLDFVVFDRCQ